MTDSDFEALRAHRLKLDFEMRKAFKENELERLAYQGLDPLDIMIHLQGLKLLWY